MERDDFIDYNILTDIVGEELAEKVCEAFGGRSVYFPKRFEIVSKHKRLIRDFFKHNVSYSELAKKYGYTESHVRNIINNERKKRRKEKKQSTEYPSQPSLFDGI